MNQILLARLSDVPELPSAVKKFVHEIVNAPYTVETIRVSEDRWFIGEHGTPEPPTRKVFDLSGVRGLLIVGPVGTGKTHLGSALMAHLSGKMIEIPYLVDCAREAVGYSEGRPAILETAATAKIALLDDLTGTRATEFAIDTIGSIVRRRYSLQLPTVFTANSDIEGLEELFGQSLASRLFEMSELVELLGKDRRLSPNRIPDSILALRSPQVRWELKEERDGA